MTRAAAILFDLDGTLLDTAPDMIGALNRLRVEHDREPLSMSEARAHVSHGALRLVRLGFPDVHDDALEPLRQRFLQLYAANLADGTCLFPGIDHVLATLEAQQLPWGVVTNKPGWLTDPLLDRLGLYERACCVVSGDTVAERKPHPLPLLHAAQTTGVAPGQCVYVGDAERDIVAGRAAGMQTVVAAYGYLSQEDQPLLWNPHGVVDRPEELLEWLTLRHHTTAVAP
ncbi:MAG TPA: phosphoglycolate phosphatase [Steroidobacteraceae bacterium]|nr:phosphoglycolate phosphatase [Steroidobacteraceae bacterium]